MNRPRSPIKNVIIYFFGALPVIWISFMVAPYVEGGLIGIIKNMNNALSHPFHFEYCEDSLKTVLVLLLVYGFAVCVYLSSRRNYRQNEEHGSAKWGDAGRINRKYVSREASQNKILTRNVAIGLDGRKHRRNLNVLVCGGSGAGKTRFYAKPNLMNANTSFVVLDPKGELLQDCGGLLQAKGYVVKVIDLLNMEKSHCYNPFVYLRTDADVFMLVTNLFTNTTPKNAQTQVLDLNNPGMRSLLGMKSLMKCGNCGKVCCADCAKEGAGGLTGLACPACGAPFATQSFVPPTEQTASAGAGASTPQAQSGNQKGGFFSRLFRKK